jgi:large conductance mechanosensitive channel
MVKEFKEFAMKGSVVDLAVGVIIGGAFGKIVSVLVEKVLMPPLGLLIGGMDFSQLRWLLKSAGADGKGEVAIGYGELIQTIINFLIIAWALFIVIRAMNSMKRKSAPVVAPAPLAVPEDILVLREIRDLLRK